jgi:formyl-CoA transferase
VKRADELDAAIGDGRSAAAATKSSAILDAADVPAASIYSVADIMSDPQYLAREMIVDTPTSDGRAAEGAGIVPKLSDTPGRIAHAAPRLGQHTTISAWRLAGARGLARRRQHVPLVSNVRGAERAL